MNKTLIHTLATFTICMTSHADSINLLGTEFNLEMEETIPEYSKTWSEVKKPTLSFLEMQANNLKQKKETISTTPISTRQRLTIIQNDLAKTIQNEIVALAVHAEKTPEDVAWVFQKGAGEPINPDLQKNMDILNGLYQIETALLTREKKEKPEKPINPPSKTKKNTALDWEYPQK